MPKAWFSILTVTLGYVVLIFDVTLLELSKGAKLRNRYNQVPHLTQDTNGKVTNSQLYTTNESHEHSPFPASDHKAQINRRTQKHNKHKAKKTLKDPHKKYRLGTVSNYFTGGLKPVTRRQPHPKFRCGSRHIDIWFA